MRSSMTRLPPPLLPILALVLAACGEQPSSPDAAGPTAAQALPLVSGAPVQVTNLTGPLVNDPGSSPSELLWADGTLYFAASTTATGTELWKTDGTEAGTSLVVDLQPGPTGSEPRPLVRLGNSLFFTARAGSSAALTLWKTDGTSLGTTPVAPQLVVADPPEFLEFNGELLFSAWAPKATSPQLWRTDGTTAGTTLLDSTNPSDMLTSPRNLRRVGSFVVFTASHPTLGEELWRTNGTHAGTVLIKDLNPGSSSSSPASFLAVGPEFYFTAVTSLTGRELWKSDGTANGTVLVRDINPGAASSDVSSMVEFNGQLLFAANDGVRGSELWISDGTSAGTQLLKDLRPGSAGSDPYWLTKTGSSVYFSANNGSIGVELYKTDGTETGTVLVRDVVPGSPSSSPSYLTNVDGTLYFVTISSSARTLWRTDGTSAGTQSVISSSSFLDTLTAAGTTLFFVYRDSTYGSEIFRTDPSMSVAQRVIDLQEGSSNDPGIDLRAAHGGRIYFAATTRTQGRELWASDGTGAGTTLLLDVNAGTANSDPGEVVPFGSSVFFPATSAQVGRELFVSDGTPGGTQLLADVNPFAGSGNPEWLTPFGGKLYFAASSTSGRGLWRTDGTITGSELVLDRYPGSILSMLDPSWLTSVGDWLIFSGVRNSPSWRYGRELFKTDGTIAGTSMVEDINSRWEGDSSNVQDVVNADGTIFFTAEDGWSGRELWLSDGTSNGTFMVKDIWYGVTSSKPQSLTAVGSRVFFTADDGLHGRELWTSDGTNAGTVLVKDIAPGAAGGIVGPLQRVGDKVFFAADDGVAGLELWKSDGTAAGTVRVTDLLPGPRGSYPTNLQAVGTTLTFTADDGVHGAELFESDGTAAGTRLVADLRPGLEPSWPGRVMRLGSKLFFAAFVSGTNRQLFALSHLDTTPPTLSCPANVSIVSSEAAGPIVVYPPATVVEEFSSATVVYSRLSGTRFPQGTTSVTVTATDEAGNAANCSFEVTVALEDVTPPTLPCSGDLTVTTEDPNGAVVFFEEPVAIDDLDPDPVVTSSHASGTVFPVGTTQVIHTATDVSNNSSRCSFTVTVILVDFTPPTLTCPPDQAVTAYDGPAGAVVTWPDAVAIDNIDDQVAITYSSESGTRFPVGTTAVEVQARDSAGNLATCTFQVTVVLEDTLPPSLTCPKAVSVRSTTSTGTPVTYPEAKVVDAVDPHPTVTYSRPSGSIFPIGTTTVVVTATDAAGHSATCTFTVSVSLDDHTPPSLQCSGNVTATATGPDGAVVNYPPAQVSDTQDPNPTVTYSRPSGSRFPIGDTTVDVSATDASNNVSRCSFTVTVTRDDHQPPTLTCPQDLRVPAEDASGAVVTYAPADVSDDIDPSPTVHYSRASGTRFPAGSTTVVVTATDASNNSATCEFTVEVVLEPDEQEEPGGADSGTATPPKSTSCGGCSATGELAMWPLWALVALVRRRKASTPPEPPAEAEEPSGGRVARRRRRRGAGAPEAACAGRPGAREPADRPSPWVGALL